MGLVVQLLGRLRVEGGEGALEASDLPGRQGRLVLAYLALHHHPVPRDELAELIWGEELPRSWERDLSAVVSKLKPLMARVGAEDALHGAFGCYELRLPGDAIVDVEAAAVHLEEAERARRAGDMPVAMGAASTAANLARRPLLPGEEGDWLEAWRERLRGIAIRSLDILVAGHRRLGEHGEAIRQAEAAIELDPYRESAYAALMRIHLEAGNRAEALRVYERCRTFLLDELGVPPGPDLEAVHREALALDVDAPAAPELPARIAVAAGAGPLVGREGPLAELRAAWETTTAGGCELFLLAGEPGIGKTRLAAELASEVSADGAQVMFGRCDPEPLASYQPFTETLRHWLAVAPPAEIRAAGAAHAADLSALLPELAAATGVPGGAGAPDRLALYDAVSRLLAAIARTSPVLLLVDDLHAADLATLALLGRLASSGRPPRVMLVGTYRHAEPGSRFSTMAAELRLDGLAREAQLTGLDAAATAQLVESRSGHALAAEKAEDWRARTGGNPLFLTQLARDPDGQAAARGVQAAIGRHLARLPEITLEPLTAAAVLGHDIDIDVLAAVVERRRQEVTSALEPAVGAEVLTEDERGGLAFGHPLVRETLYAGLAAGRRRELHRRAATALEELKPESLQPLAHHFTSAADDLEKVVHYAEAAAKEAARQLAVEDCLEIIDRALELVPEKDAGTRSRLLSTRARASVVAWHIHAEGRRIQILD